ncbi:MAG: cytochrome c3 family protein [Candidatus Zixiibacteriota bacterium]
MLTAIKTVVIAAAGLWLGFTGFRKYEASQVQQPYEFNHAAHRVMACVRCHVGAIDGVRSTLPSFEICQNCHTGSPKSGEKAEAAWAKAVQDGGFKWKKATSVPDHVFYSHRLHTKSGQIPCESCHAEIGDLTGPPTLPLIRIQMSFCIDCHEERGVTEDCARCHK